MKNKIKSIFVSLLVLLAGTVSVFADEKNTEKAHRMPKRGEAVIISRASISSPIDFEGRRKGYDISDENFSDQVEIVLRTVRASQWGSPVMDNSVSDEGFVFTYAKVDSKTNSTEIKGFDCFLFKSICYRFILPIFANVTIPEDCQFIYIGSFDYKLDYALRVTDIKRKDELKAATAWAKKTFNKEDIEVVRGELAPLSD